MSERFPTIDSLVALGFTQVTGVVVETVRYNFQHFELDAKGVWWWGDKVMLSGFGRYKNDVLVMDPGDMWSANVIPNDLRNTTEAAAWISFMLKDWRDKLGPLPDWFIEGESNWHLAPPAREWLERKKRRQAYEAAPKCFIDRDYARPLRRNLMEEVSRLREGEEAGMMFSFDGRVLSVDFRGRVHEVVASGESWPTSFLVLVSSETRFPTRFEQWRVEVSVFDGYVRLDRLKFGPFKTGPNAESP